MKYEGRFLVFPLPAYFIPHSRSQDEVYWHLMSLEMKAIRRHFPFLTRRDASIPLTYLDSAATSQKPDVVLDAMRTFYETANGNPHRGMHPLAEKATIAYESARQTVQHFIHAAHSDEIIFTKSTTESLNLLAHSLGGNLQSGDAVLVSVLEHHSNIVPWLQLKERKGIDVRWIEMTDDGQIDLTSMEMQMKDDKVKIVSITGLSNVLGVAPDLKKIGEMAHAKNALFIVDAAQMAAHLPIDVTAINGDFLAFSGHKIYGPTGIGVLYGKRDLHKKLPPFLGGGMMIREVTRESFTTADAPAKFEAGTPPVAEAVGLKAAIDWQNQFSWDDRIKHEQSLLTLAYNELSQIPHLRILGMYGQNTIPPVRYGCLSFTIDGVHPHDLTDLLGQKGICLRAGHHCAQPLHTTLGINATTRLSVSLHTTDDEIRMVRPAVLDAMKILRS